MFTEQGSGYQETDWFHAYDINFTGGVDVAVADLGGDGVDEIITSAGMGGSPHIRTFRPDGSFITQFFAYEQNMRSGVSLATGDFDGDGVHSVVTVPGEGAGPQVRVFKGTGAVEHTAGFFAEDPAYHGGLRVAAGDVNGDGVDEIITGTGYATRSHVRVFSGTGEQLPIDFFPFAEEFEGGVDVAVGNFDGDTTQDEIAVSVRSGGESWVKVYRYNEERTIIAEWKVFSGEGGGFDGGVYIEAGDLDGNGTDELVASVAGGGGPQFMAFNSDGTAVSPGVFAYDEEFYGGVAVAIGQTDATTESAEIITAPSKPKPDWFRPAEARSVRINLAEQRLYAYEYGYEVRSFLISGGLPSTPTPVGEFRIQREVYSKHYYGEDYNYPGTLYNMQFFPRYYLHGAYWHENWGNPMSHGCINIDYGNAEWIWNWIEVGDLVVTHW